MKIRLIGLIGLIGLIATPALAMTGMESASYKVQFPSLNMTGGTKSSTNYNILDTLGQIGPGLYSSTGFYVKAGFPYIKTIIPFSFTISNLSVSFGHLTPSVFSTLSNTLTVSSGGAGGYQVTAIANHPLQLQGTAVTIPDTTCDSATCSETAAGVWTNTAKYGFGYNLSGNDVPAAFVDSTYYKQFSDASLNEAGQIVMSSANVGKNRVATVTYKVNISTTQAAGDYDNMITFVATPGY